MKPSHYQWLGTTGFLFLVIFLTLRTGWLSPPESFPKSIALLLLVGPMMFAVRGMLHGRPYTHGWSLFLALLYFTAGVVFAVGPDAKWQGYLVIALSLMWFLGSMMYLRELGKIRKAAAAGLPSSDVASGQNASDR